MKLIKSITNNKKIFTILVLSFMLLNKSIEAYAAISSSNPIQINKSKFSNSEYDLDNAQLYFDFIIFALNQDKDFKPDAVNYYSKLKSILTYNAKRCQYSIDDEINQLDILFEDYLKSNDSIKLEEFKLNFNLLVNNIKIESTAASLIHSILSILIMLFAFSAILVIFHWIKYMPIRNKMQEGSDV